MYHSFIMDLPSLFLLDALPIRRGEGGGCGVGRAFRVARVLFLLLKSWATRVTHPHPAGDPKGPPFHSPPPSPLRITWLSAFACTLPHAVCMDTSIGGGREPMAERTSCVRSSRSKGFDATGMWCCCV